MKKHNDPITPETLIDTVPTLPDRSDLSKLYPEAKQSFLTIDEARENILDDEHVAITIGIMSVKTGLLVPLPFVLALIPAVWFLINTTSNNIFSMLPLMTLTIFIWGIAITLTFNKVNKLLDHLSVPTFTFLSLQISCLMLVAQPLYATALALTNPWIGQALFSLALLSLSIVFSWLFLQLILNHTLLDKTKIKLITLIVLLCLSSSVIYLLLSQS